MEITEHYNYFEDVNLQSIELPYNKESFSALVILPKKNLNINELIEILDKNKDYLYSIINNMKYNKVNLILPKFELEYSKSLKEILKDMDVKLPFENIADFSKIRAQNDIHIDDIIHKTYLKVNEQGTEVAAVTAIIVFISKIEELN